jgi:hypothetical protein
MKSADKKNVTSTQIQNVFSNVQVTPITTITKRNLYIIRGKNGKTLKVWSELEPKEFYKTLKLKHK